MTGCHHTREKTMKSMMLCSVIWAFLTTTMSAGAASHAAEDSTIESVAGWLFVGCRPSMGECSLSCPERNGRGVDQDHQCVDDRSGFRVGCYCPGGRESEPVDPEQFDFMGCYYSAGECGLSCRGRMTTTRPHDERCTYEGVAHLGCYCSKAGHPGF